MQAPLDAVLQLEAGYPLLLATARNLQAQTALTAVRPVATIRADLDKVYMAKVEHDRRHLIERWEELMNQAKTRATQLQTLIPLFDRVAGGTADTAVRREWWQPYGEVLSIFPVIYRARESAGRGRPPATLEQAGGILEAMVRYADGRARRIGRAPPFPRGPSAGAAGAAAERGGGPPHLAEPAGGGS